MALQRGRHLEALGKVPLIVIIDVTIKHNIIRSKRSTEDVIGPHFTQSRFDDFP